MGTNDFGSFANLSLSGQITSNRKEGKIYVADFKNNTGKYISSVFDSDNPVDVVLQISPKVNVRISYIFEKNDIRGLQLIKTNGRSEEKMTLSSFDGKNILALLQLFSQIDLNGIANESIVLHKNIIKNPEELVKFLNTIATDPQGKEKLREVSKNLGLLTPSFISEIARRKNNAVDMERMINDNDYFYSLKSYLKVGKDEEVWQQFFEENDWILGSDIVEILDYRGLDEHNKTDLPVKSLDGFLDIIELKLPSSSFWNACIIPIPTAGLTKATMQCARYLQAAEKKQNDKDKIKELGCDILKPRITLIYGRSNNWSDEKWEHFRLLNSLYHNINIMTYDLVLKRAKRILDFSTKI
ncbi:MAG: DUF4263 domain-containing protein [Elusimicrobiota bacterium]|jgi:hypothetical protein|nr:DUF4263 domain-containing protein [Elusimicrobiota bacterium]